MVVSQESLLERLGFAPDARVVVIHCDDIGMCHASNVGSFEALDQGPASCGSVMVPCAWFPKAAAWAAERPDIDLGVHLTLNAEWEHYRWGPVAGAQKVPSLVDEQGFLFRSTAETVAKAKLEDVVIELRAQIERALAFGIDVTHIDSHMGTCFFPPFLEAYVDLAIEYQIPALAIRPDVTMLKAVGLADSAAEISRCIEKFAQAGGPIVNGLDANSLHFAPGEGEAHNRARLEAMGPGVHYLICHPTKGGEEFDALGTGGYMRDFERSFYGGAAGRALIEELGFSVIGMRALRDQMRT